ncbi:hypothetical protein GGI25_000680 [Coemansia spiralis]|uniref:Velvet domain-containing protein n=2 Tax=Coemansia TaxID=4863 RepID=A0A9W8GE95_9FUNG|nr:hypothetical protein EDC05_000638 [Coemansia umbellata]KAJ2680388.1 hypothetical protein GGI25_000680 [Coemansia spiralis]
MEHSVNFGHVQQTVTNRREIEHSLVLRQEPNRSRMCGIGEKADRRPVDPPPIIQLHVTDPTTSNNRVYLHNPYYFMYATLMDERGERELNTLNDKKARTMTGSVVASLAHLKDIDGNDGAFFVFPDLSVRCEGVYKLKFSLFEIVGNQVFFCKSITSAMFTVYSAKKFPGMEESTRLTKLFAEQGLKIRVRKEQKSTRPKGGRSRPIATAHHSGRNSPTHMSHHMPTWAMDHRPTTVGNLPYSGSSHHHQSDRAQQRPQYSTTPMSVVSPPVGPTNTVPSSRMTPSGGAWSGAVQSRQTNATPGDPGLSQSPQPQPSISQYAPAASTASAEPHHLHDPDASGYVQYHHSQRQHRHQHSHHQYSTYQAQQLSHNNTGSSDHPPHHTLNQQYNHHGQHQPPPPSHYSQQQLQQHRAQSNSSPVPHSRSHSHQQTTSYSHPMANTLSSSATAMGGRHSSSVVTASASVSSSSSAAAATAATPPGSDSQSALTPGMGALHQQPPKPQPLSQMFSGTPRSSDRHQPYSSEPLAVQQSPADYPDNPMNRSLPQNMSQYRQPHPSDDSGRHHYQQQQQQQQQRYQYGQHRPWSPHHRSQQHYSPTHSGHAFTSDPRYSPYNRQLDGPREARQHVPQTSSSARISNLVGPSAADSMSGYSEQPSLRHQTHAMSRARTHQNSPDHTQRHPLAQGHPSTRQPHPSHQSMVSSSESSISNLASLPHSQLGGGGESRYKQYPPPPPLPQQQVEHGSQKKLIVRSPSPEARPSTALGNGSTNTNSGQRSSSSSRAPATHEMPPNLPTDNGSVAVTADGPVSPAPTHRMAVRSLLISESTSPEKAHHGSSN